MRRNAYDALLNRRDPERLHTFSAKEAFADLHEDTAVKYLAGAMEQVGPQYTKKSFEEGERIWNQIEKGLSRNGRSGEHRFQGSTTKNTHIKGHSDLDLLVIETRYVELEHPQVPQNPYTGNPIRDLIEIRLICIETLKAAFYAAKVDSSSAHAVKLSGGSLDRVVDVVTAAWWNTNAYATHGNDFFRGVEILNCHVPSREPDTPFYHAKIIELADYRTRGNVKKLDRLMKTLRAEGDVTICSFDIESLNYRMDEGSLQGTEEQEIQTAKICYDWLVRVESDAVLRDSLYVPDGSRKIFASGKATLAQLTALRNELGELLRQIEQSLNRSMRKLADARLKWSQQPVYPNIYLGR